MSLYSEDELGALRPAEEREPRTPLPVRMVASEEYLPVSQTARQRRNSA